MRVSKLALLMAAVAVAGCSGRVNRTGEVEGPGTGTGKEQGPGPTDGPGRGPSGGPSSGPAGDAPDCSSDPLSQRHLVFDSQRQGSRDFYLMHADGSRFFASGSV